MANPKYNSGRILKLVPKDDKAPKRLAYVFKYPNGTEYSVRVFALNGEAVYSMRGYNSESIASKAIQRECYGLIEIRFKRPPSLSVLKKTITHKH